MHSSHKLYPLAIVLTQSMFLDLPIARGKEGLEKLAHFRCNSGM